MPIKNLEKKEEILWRAKNLRKPKGNRNAAKDSQKNKTDNHMKEVETRKKKEDATVNGIWDVETQVTKFFYLQR